ncbi:MAG: hypothetical protein ACO2ZZ_11070 [Cyclobacteriaceae bacterium]
MEKDILILREFIDVLSSDEANNKEEIQAELDLMEAQIRAIEENWSK